MRVQNASTSVCGCPHLGCSHSCRPRLVGSLFVSIKGSFSPLGVQLQHPGVNLESSLHHIVCLQCRNPLSRPVGSLWGGHLAPAPLLSPPLMVSVATISSWMTVVASHWVSALSFSPAICSQHSTVRTLCM